MAHYGNGRAAYNGDPVVGKGYSGEVVAGSIYAIVPGSESCNCSVAVPVMGGVNHLTCQTVGNWYHAEDAFNLMKSGNVPPPMPLPPSSMDAAPDAPPVSNANVAEGCEPFTSPPPAPTAS